MAAEDRTAASGCPENDPLCDGEMVTPPGEPGYSYPCPVRSAACEHGCKPDAIVFGCPVHDWLTGGAPEPDESPAAHTASRWPPPMRTWRSKRAWLRAWLRSRLHV